MERAHRFICSDSDIEIVHFSKGCSPFSTKIPEKDALNAIHPYTLQW